MERVQLPDEVKQALRGSILGYLHNATEAYVKPLERDMEFSTHGSIVNGKFLSCLVGKTTLPTGTKVYAFRHQRISYLEYRWVGDEQYPAKGAKIFTTGSDWTLVAIVDLAGNEVIAQDYVATARTEKRQIGVVS